MLKKAEKERGSYYPEDGMSVIFTVIMLSSKKIISEIYIGGCIDSADIVNLPDFQRFAEKCKGEIIEVDNCAYQLDGEDYHTRKATKDEIRRIVGADFPYNYDGKLYPVSHAGPDQFKLKEGGTFRYWLQSGGSIHEFVIAD